MKLFDFYTGIKFLSFKPNFIFEDNKRERTGMVTYISNFRIN